MLASRMFARTGIRFDARRLSSPDTTHPRRGRAASANNSGEGGEKTSTENGSPFRRGVDGHIAAAQLADAFGCLVPFPAAAFRRIAAEFFAASPRPPRARKSRARDWNVSEIAEVAFGSMQIAGRHRWRLLSSERYTRSCRCSRAHAHRVRGEVLGVVVDQVAFERWRPGRIPTQVECLTFRGLRTSLLFAFHGLVFSAGPRLATVHLPTRAVTDLDLHARPRA
jgi:hypothetical protein